ncbi:MAG: hypothetical protein Ct9H300mP4_03990 [Gammaproteobacteria bacterium]|nr:MAG: hypothetical protein Ct9H300mP4_03990 [Gammaproteobacteria bacterium]
MQKKSMITNLGLYPLSLVLHYLPMIMVDHVLKKSLKKYQIFKKRSWLIIEHGHDQSYFCKQLMQSFQLRTIQTTLDYSGVGRITAGQRFN